MRTHVGRALGQQQSRLLPHDDRDQHGRMTGWLVSETRFPADLGFPVRRGEKAGPQRLWGQQRRIHCRKMSVHSDNGNGARIEVRRAACHRRWSFNE